MRGQDVTILFDARVAPEWRNDLQNVRQLRMVVVDTMCCVVQSQPNRYTDLDGLVTVVRERNARTARRCVREEQIGLGSVVAVYRRLGGGRFGLRTYTSRALG